MTLEIIIVFITGLFGGFMGSQAGGGGILTLPVLLFLGLPAPVAIATNRVGSLFLTISGGFQYVKSGKIKIKYVLPFVAFAVAGALIGANIVLQIDEIFLKRIIAFILIAVIVLALYEKNLGLHDHVMRTSKNGKIELAVLIFVISIYAGSIGVASGTILALLFVLFGQSFTQGMGYSLAVGFTTCLAATIFFMISGVVVYELAIPLALGFASGAWMGARYAIHKGNKWVKYLFIVIATVFTMKILFETFI